MKTPNSEMKIDKRSVSHLPRPGVTVSPEERAAAVLEKHGPNKAWLIVIKWTRLAEMTGRLADRNYLKKVQEALHKIAPSPGPQDSDVFRMAKILISEHGTHEAWRKAIEMAAAEDSSLMHQAILLRVVDAIKAMSPGGPEERRINF